MILKRQRQILTALFYCTLYIVEDMDMKKREEVKIASQTRVFVTVMFIITRNTETRENRMQTGLLHETNLMKYPKRTNTTKKKNVSVAIRKIPETREIPRRTEVTRKRGHSFMLCYS